MERRIFHGELTPNDLARALMGEFNRGNMSARQFGDAREIVVQIATDNQVTSGGQTAISITLRSVPDGVMVEIGQQSWLGIAASLGQTAFWALRNPWNLIGRLDDLAQDIQNIQLANAVLEVIDRAAQSLGAGMEISTRLKHSVCKYCHTANPFGVPSCLACGAPMGGAQPRSCQNCGFIVKETELVCPNCGKLMSRN